MNHLLDDVLELSPDYDANLVTACLTQDDRPWWEVAIEAQEIVWQARCCVRKDYCLCVGECRCKPKTPRWLRLLGKDVSQWVRWQSKTEAWSAGRGETWQATALRLGVRHE